MGKAGEALKQTLESYKISQNQLATALNAKRPVINRWFHSQVDPTAETVVDILKALQNINPEASQEFVKLYLGDWIIEPKPSVLVQPTELPSSDQVDVSALSRLFADTTNSYKYLFFISLLDILKRRLFEVLSPISFEEIIVEVLANAWYPHTYFKLSFGSQDKISQKLDALKLEIYEPILNFTDADKKLLRKTIVSQDLKDIVASLAKYVPFRLISPFFKQEIKLHNVNSGRGTDLEYAMPEIAENYFESRKPLYRFDSNEKRNCKSIILHPSWAEYLEENYSIVRAWAAWEWLGYMQKCNPSTPALVNKLFMPSQRESLSKQTKYWKLILEKRPETCCIYSNQILNPTRLSLDHYLPWSFVAHDQLWNLVPIVPEVNSSKSNNLPSQKYFTQFVEIQHLGLVTSHQFMKKNTWEKYVEPYTSDLKLSSEDLLDLDRLKNAYELTLIPLMNLAKNQGFSTEWSFS
ncbi:HNH endonuclease domain-containing protein [Limnoraphis robusta Tam1]|uniref:HNH endonuclease domain-containing protein n=1 Tax=Limnoraphis robusta TaxID=1118279 RepID=UPI002B1F5CB0|nr:HNH endonuclease domain-containing protein [Limnoraphis robusta]MEA5499191.1 HNH endonuclease domain-containing protein [Limnoraphis robusta BA-68 BA1]MEA5540688.1 HNH endonuclease domain-containing protein [Limnoraphis robusta Tam1]